MVMAIRYMSFITLCFFTALGAVDVSVSADQREKMRLCVVTHDDELVRSMAEIIAKDLGWSKQFDVDCLVRQRLNSKKEIKLLAHQNYPLIIFLTHSGKAVEWRLYDALQAHMIQGKKVKKGGSGERGWAHRCADGIWEALTGTQGSFSSKIVYCKEKRIQGKVRPYKYLYLSDYDGSNARALVTSPTVSLAPRWNRAGADKPLIYYSECTPSNVRLMAVNMEGTRKIISNFDGLNMSVAWASDGHKAVVCLSRNGSTQLYLYHALDETGHRKPLEQLTTSGLNVSPCFMNDDEILLCSDDNGTKRPHICTMNLHDRVVEPLIKGYCSTPSYCPRTKKLAYSKRIDGKLQLFTYDFGTKQEKQLTDDMRNKDSCSWSPCGTYLVFSVEDGISCRIATHNLKTGKRAYITPVDVRCSYPAWAPRYISGQYIE